MRSAPAEFVMSIRAELAMIAISHAAPAPSVVPAVTATLVR